MCRAKIDKTGLKRKYKTVIEHKMHAFAYLIHLSIPVSYTHLTLPTN